MKFNPEERQRWLKHFQAHMEAVCAEGTPDPAHDLAHFQRVHATASQLCEEEGARWEIVAPAAWLHDLVNVPKNDPRRSQASRLSGDAAVAYLSHLGYPPECLDEIRHAIEAHSYSAAIEPRSLEAQVVQDADRLDGLGAIGIARCFCVTGILGRKLYSERDPFSVTRSLDDLEYAVDHFYVKLFKTADLLKTRAGRNEGQRRVHVMRDFLKELGREIGHSARV